LSWTLVDPAATADAVLRIRGEIGPLDLAILNAGTHQSQYAREFDLVTAQHLVDVNLMGTVNCLARILPEFIERRAGRIAVVASIAGYRGLPGAAAYGATKAALINLCESLKPDLDACGVGLILINPGFVQTPSDG
jgi:NADP-dependent 3-hydroxy acid dehydrogenase YdfG